jgi:hypothetical protein
MLNAGLGQLGQFGQTQQLMANQKSRDADMMTRWNDYMDMISGKRNPAGTSTQGAYTPEGSYQNQMAGRELVGEDYLYSK